MENRLKRTVNRGRETSCKAIQGAGWGAGWLDLGWWGGSLKKEKCGYVLKVETRIGIGVWEAKDRGFKDDSSAIIWMVVPLTGRSDEGATSREEEWERNMKWGGGEAHRFLFIQQLTYWGWFLPTPSQALSSLLCNLTEGPTRIFLSWTIWWFFSHSLPLSTFLLPSHCNPYVQQKYPTTSKWTEE